MTLPAALVQTASFGVRPTGFAKVVRDIVANLPLTLFIRALRG